MALGDETAPQITLRVLTESIDPNIAAANDTTVPPELANLYAQFIAQSNYLPPSTGLSYVESLNAGGWMPYTGQGS
jgi:hypothetical protein